MRNLKVFLLFLLIGGWASSISSARQILLQHLYRIPQNKVLDVFGAGVGYRNFAIIHSQKVAFLVQTHHGSRRYRPVVFDLDMLNVQPFIKGIKEVPQVTRLCVGQDGNRYLLFPVPDNVLVRADQRGNILDRVYLNDFGDIDIASDGTIYIASLTINIRNEVRYIVRAYRPDGELLWKSMRVRDYLPEDMHKRIVPVNIFAASNGVYVHIDKNIYFLDRVGRVQYHFSIPIRSDEEEVLLLMPLGRERFIVQIAIESAPINSLPPELKHRVKEILQDRVFVFNRNGERFTVPFQKVGLFPGDVSILAFSRDGHIFWWKKNEMGMARLNADVSFSSKN